MQQLIFDVQSFFGPDWRVVFDFFSEYGGPWGWFVVYLLVFYFAGTAVGMRVALITLTAAVTNTWLKWLILEPRPYYTSGDLQAMKATPGFGMPSGHAQGVAAQWGGIAMQYRRFWLWGVALLIILMTGLSRIYYAVHSLPQVLVGWVLGGFCVWLVLTLEPTLLEWLRKWSGPVQIFFTTLFVIILLLGSLGILHLQSDFSVPPLWQENFAATVTRTGDVQHFSLFGPAALLMFGLLYGLLLMGLYLMNRGSIPVSGWKQRLLNLGFGAPLVLVFFWLLSLVGFDASPRAYLMMSLLLVVQPFLTILLPMRLSQRYTVPLPK